MEEYFELYKKYSSYTMIHPNTYIRNLVLSELCKDIEGAVVECGTWRGGMIAGIAELLQGDRKYYLFDSFEGLPTAKEIDGSSAIAWQANTDSPFYYDNCTADEVSAREAMALSGIQNYSVIQRLV
jgi:O-methyltransferase